MFGRGCSDAGAKQPGGPETSGHAHQDTAASAKVWPRLQGMRPITASLENGASWVPHSNPVHLGMLACGDDQHAVERRVGKERRHVVTVPSGTLCKWWTIRGEELSGATMSRGAGKKLQSAEAELPQPPLHVAASLPLSLGHLCSVHRTSFCILTVYRVLQTPGGCLDAEQGVGRLSHFARILGKISSYGAF